MFQLKKIKFIWFIIQLKISKIMKKSYKRTLVLSLFLKKKISKKVVLHNLYQIKKIKMWFFLRKKHLKIYNWFIINKILTLQPTLLLFLILLLHINLILLILNVILLKFKSLFLKTRIQTIFLNPKIKIKNLWLRNQKLFIKTENLYHKKFTRFK